MRAHCVPYGCKVSVTIRRDNGVAYVDVHAPLYMRKQWTMAHCYDSAQFSDGAILRDSDFNTVLTNRYGANNEGKV